MLRKATAFALPLVLAILGWSTISAQELTASERDAVLVELYSKGVHAYFDGEYETALEHLDKAISGGTYDPRAYYFRGLAKFQLGNTDEARGDFLAGAEMELAGTPQYFPINRSLERVQGDSRQLLEQTRAFAREEAERRQKAYRAARYEQLQIAEERVLRKPVGELPQLPEVDLSRVPNLPFKTNGG